MEYHFQYPAGLSEGVVLEIRPSLGRHHRSERARIRIHLDGNSRDVVLRNSIRSQIEIPDGFVGKTDVVITMEFLGAVSEGIRIPSLNWSGSDALQLRVREGSLLSSLLRSQLLLWIRCGFVAALGLMVSTFLGLPVATLLMLCFSSQRPEEDLPVPSMKAMEGPIPMLGIKNLRGSSSICWPVEGSGSSASSGIGVVM
jgi:hypothetical protein